MKKNKSILSAFILFIAFNFSAQVYAQTDAAAESVTKIQNIVVTSASLNEQDIASAPASMTVVTKEDIEKQPVRDVADVLRYAEGIMLTGANDKGISLRGFDSSYTLILVNGKRLSSRSLSVRHNADADLSWIAPNDIERIEIIRGPMATLYGAEAIGGVVNIITKKISSTWNGNISTSYTSPEENSEGAQSQVSTSVSGPVIKDTLGLRLTGTTSEQVQPDLPTTDSRQFAGHKDSSFNSELDWKLNNNHAFNFEFGQNFETQVSKSRGDDVTTQVDRTHLSLEHKGTWEKTRTELRVFGDSYDYSIGGQLAELENRTAQGQVHLPLFDGSHFLVAGIDAEQNVLKNKAQLDSGETTSDQTSMFLENAIAISDKDTLTVGARRIEHRNFGGHVSPRAYLVHNASSELTFKGGVGTGFKTPTLLQLDKGFHLSSCQGACTMVGNPDLKPETSVNYELGTAYTQERWSLNATVFQSELRDMITTYFETIGGTRYRLLHNVEEARTRGIELGVKFKTIEFVELGTNATFTEARNISQDTPLTNIPDYIVNASFDWKTTERLTTYFVASHMGSRKVEATTGSSTLDSYTLFNAGASYKLPKWILTKATVSGGIENLANHVLSNDYGFGEPGRRYFLKLNMDFAQL